MKTDFYIMPAEFVGMAEEKDGVLNVGGLEVNTGGWWNTGDIAVYVRRNSQNLQVIEVVMAKHDGLSQEELDSQNDEAARYPLGAKEYWRSKHLAEGNTEEEFNDFWGGDEDD